MSSALSIARVPNLRHRMGFVLSGMNGGALIAPFVEGAIYDHVGYHAAWGVCLAVIAVDVVLRLAMMEKHRARKWLDEDPRVGHSGNASFHDEETSLLHNSDVDSASDTSSTLSVPPAYVSPPPTKDSAKPISPEGTSWFAEKFPAMSLLLKSPRILAAVYGCFTHTLLISSFDAILAVFVKRTFFWSPTNAGLIYIAITIPSTLGALIGAISDRYGTRATALFGFGLTTPSLALLGVINKSDVGHQAGLIVLLVANGTSTLISLIYNICLGC